jgi:hypothetical protein
MTQLIKKIKNNRSVIFDTGKFDDWCVYLVESDGTKKAPFDETYFSDLYNISQKYNQNKVYNDFVNVYDLTTKTINPLALKLIDEIVETYNQEDQILVEQWFTVIYAGMIAEENKEKAILKKKNKKIGDVSGIDFKYASQRCRKIQLRQTMARFGCNNETFWILITPFFKSEDKAF